jgi:hypothetical protein
MMQKELEKWRDEYDSHSKALKRQQQYEKHFGNSFILYFNKNYLILGKRNYHWNRTKPL